LLGTEPELPDRAGPRMPAVPERVLNRTADAFYVKVMKDFTIDEKRAKVVLANRHGCQSASSLGRQRRRPRLPPRFVRLAHFAQRGE
jgi:hypothetical protein